MRGRHDKVKNMRESEDTAQTRQSERHREPLSVSRAAVSVGQREQRHAPVIVNQGVRVGRWKRIFDELLTTNVLNFMPIQYI